MNAYEILLLSIGFIVLASGVAMSFMRAKGWLAAISIGGLWLLAMALYMVYRYSGFYSPTGGLAQGSVGPAVTTILGFLILIAGIGIFIYLFRRGGR